MRITGIRSKDRTDWVISTISEPTWLGRVILRQAPVAEEFYSRHGIVWYSLPHMDMVDDDVQSWLREVVSGEKALMDYNESLPYTTPIV